LFDVVDFARHASGDLVFGELINELLVCNPILPYQPIEALMRDIISGRNPLDVDTYLDWRMVLREVTNKN